MGLRPEPLVAFDPAATGARLRAHRNHHGWALEDVCRQCQHPIGPSALSKIERGKRAPTCAQLVALAHVFGTSTDILLGLPPRRRRAAACLPPHEETL
jgi:XRE family transcriptional regulator, fatty acid utilization regulator